MKIHSNMKDLTVEEIVMNSEDFNLPKHLRKIGGIYFAESKDVGNSPKSVQSLLTELISRLPTMRTDLEYCLSRDNEPLFSSSEEDSAAPPLGRIWSKYSLQAKTSARKYDMCVQKTAPAFSCYLSALVLQLYFALQSRKALKFPSVESFLAVYGEFSGCGDETVELYWTSANLIACFQSLVPAASNKTWIVQQLLSRITLARETRYKPGGGTKGSSTGRNKEFTDLLSIYEHEGCIIASEWSSKRREKRQRSTGRVAEGSVAVRTVDGKRSPPQLLQQTARPLAVVEAHAAKMQRVGSPPLSIASRSLSSSSSTCSRHDDDYATVVAMGMDGEGDGEGACSDADTDRIIYELLCGDGQQENGGAALASEEASGGSGLAGGADEQLYWGGSYGVGSDGSLGLGFDGPLDSPPVVHGDVDESLQLFDWYDLDAFEATTAEVEATGCASDITDEGSVWSASGSGGGGSPSVMPSRGPSYDALQTSRHPSVVQMQVPVPIPTAVAAPVRAAVAVCSFPVARTTATATATAAATIASSSDLDSDPVVGAGGAADIVGRSTMRSIAFDVPSSPPPVAVPISPTASASSAAPVPATAHALCRTPTSIMDCDAAAFGSGEGVHSLLLNAEEEAAEGSAPVCSSNSTRAEAAAVMRGGSVRGGSASASASASASSEASETDSSSDGLAAAEEGAGSNARSDTSEGSVASSFSGPVEDNAAVGGGRSGGTAPVKHPPVGVTGDTGGYFSRSGSGSDGDGGGGGAAAEQYTSTDSMEAYFAQWD